MLGPELFVAQRRQQKEGPVSGLSELVSENARVQSRSGYGSHGVSGGHPARAFMKGTTPMYGGFGCSASWLGGALGRSVTLCRARKFPRLSSAARIGWSVTRRGGNMMSQSLMPVSEL